MAPSSAGPAPAHAVEVHGLTKVYGRDGRRQRKALDGVDLAIPQGAFFGLLGPNGAGKSTLINILAGLVIKTAGSASVWGFDIDRDPRQARAHIGVVPQELLVDPFFSPREALDNQAGYYGVPKRERRTEEILAAVGLTEVAHANARGLSGGMRRRLLVAKALVHAPPVLVLDEPTAGVDVDLRHQLWNYVLGLNAQGTTVLLTTHYLEEAEQLCDRIAIIHQGRLVALDETTELVKRVDQKMLTIVLGEDTEGIPPALQRFDADLKPYRQLTIKYRQSETQISEILAAVSDAGLTIADLTTTESDLEDIFLHLTKETAEGT